MSLNVHVYVRSVFGKKIILDTPPDISRAAGFESWRTDIWGSSRVRSLGAEFFPRLATDALYVSSRHVIQFQRECALLRRNLKFVAGDVDPLNPKALSFNLATKSIVEPADPQAAFLETVSQRLANIEVAAVRARELGGGVVIM